ncbi:helix-turn-helix domain-containing protein [Mucilaginibacter lappiensis]|uniref:Transcriptional regulator with XRE-family HTH domain n=1 Tax=Mucilaginibacter lappiensis TaxID=354630 RepID=A0A841JGV3_9SPHI|nr:helix-turn-helix transcriptional regulator [Mucilaginibacter lappiensis]MBB6130389.1 transcriptional regulator with XRE-family HTH domain [Mucilaginibacter lappiensis]
MLNPYYALITDQRESGEALPSIEIAAKIAKALNISLDYLSELSDTELDSILLSRINEITSLPDEEQKQIFTVVDALISDYKAKKVNSK